MLYQILILVAKEKLCAMDVNKNGKTETISIEGNKIMTYTSIDDIHYFSQCIKDYYNINDFSDIDLDVLIIKFDVSFSNAFCILEEMKTANEYNLINIEKLLPILVLKEGWIRPDTTLQVEIFGSEYWIKIDSNLKFECKKGENGQDKVELPIERLSQYFCFDANNLIDNKQELKKWQEAFRNELKRKEDAIDKLEKELQTEKGKLDFVVTNLYRIREEKKKNTKRYICKFEKNNYKKPIASTFYGLVLNSYDDWLKRAEYRIKYLITDGAVVKKDQKIAMARAFYGNERIDGSDIAITASENGRIYCLMSSEATIRDGDAVALIGDLSDNKEDIIQWYEKNK